MDRDGDRERASTLSIPIPNRDIDIDRDRDRDRDRKRRRKVYLSLSLENANSVRTSTQYSPTSFMLSMRQGVIIFKAKDDDSFKGWLFAFHRSLSLLLSIYLDREKNEIDR